jgi:hypothetical protein
MAITIKPKILRKALMIAAATAKEEATAAANGKNLTISQNVRTPKLGLDGDKTLIIANSLKDDNESNSNDKGVWEGFDDLPERRKLDYILILNKTLEDTSRSALQRFNKGIRYDLFINNLGEINTVRDLILNSINRDLLDLIKNGDLSLKSLKKLKRKNSAMKQKSGIYVYVVYNLDKPDVVGIYVKSAERLAFRIKYYIGEYKEFIRP